MNINCPICDKECKSIRSITKHISMMHCKIAKDVLFETNPDLFRNCMMCKKIIKHYKTDSRSRKCCNRLCADNLKKGKKQPQEVIAKRIKNTNQVKKENTRKNTMITKYGGMYKCFNPELKSKRLSKILSGRIRSKEHSKKIIDSKRKNNTLKHSEKTKQKISLSVRKKFNNVHFDKSKFIKRYNTKYSSSYYKGFYTRSSYEKKFIDFCNKYNIKCISAECNKFSVKYEAEPGYIRTYFPDFYLEDFDLVVEIKPISMMDFKFNLNKFDAMHKKCRFVIITEENYLLEPEKWDLLYDELLQI